MNIVEKIHREIDTAQDRLLESALKVINETNIEEETKIEQRASRLEKLGFTSTPIVKAGNEIKSKRKEKRQFIELNKEQAKLIQYYKQKYPLHKFLTEEELERICDKYSLVFAPVDKYKKDIPEKNLREIETMKPIEDKDIVSELYKFIGNNHRGLIGDFLKCLNKKEMVFTYEDLLDLGTKFNVRCFFDKKSATYDPRLGIFLMSEKLDMYNYISPQSMKVIDRSCLFIAAPKSHFDLKGLSQDTKNGLFRIKKIEPKDPIVFKYVKGGVLVITKWGDEASDEMLLNELNN